MLKKLLSMAMLLIGAAMVVTPEAAAQGDMQNPVLPLNPKVIHGQLPNGLNYYILHNEEPKGRANFYIAQKVGSTLETPEQLGLAHFLEHMAFNGTKNFPGKDLLNKLQAKGIRFGADINAYTSFDETVYNIDNIPTDDPELMDIALLALHDWSAEISLVDEEIDNERKVIQEEWRMRNDAGTRMYTALLPQIYSEYQYQQMPIGKMEIVMNFPYKDLRDYYHKWYRPDQQGIIIVGDFDASEMEKKVIEMFSSIQMPENAAERTYPQVSDNPEPIYTTFVDPELQYAMAQVMFKSEKIPFEYRNTAFAYTQTHLDEALVTAMINNRLQELVQKPDCPFAYAGVAFDDFLVSQTKSCFALTVIAKDNIQTALNTAMAEVSRACKAGFTQSELERAFQDLLAGYEKRYNERDKTRTDVLAQGLIRTFVENTANPGIEKEYEIIKGIAPYIQIPQLVDQFNEFAKTILTPENQVIIVSLPESMAATMPTKENMIADIEQRLQAEYEAYEDVKITEPLIPNLPAAGKITSTESGNFETTEMTLSNGVKVVVKPTDFASDEIRMTAVRHGGKVDYPADQAANIAAMDLATESFKLGSFDNIMQQRYLAGKTMSISYSIGNLTTSVDGSSSVKDLPTLMEFVHAYFTELEPDEQTYAANESAIRSLLQNQQNNPNRIFNDSVMSALYDHNPMMTPLSIEKLDKANYLEMLDIARKSLSNAADFTFIFVGNVDMETLKPLLENYIANLPSLGVAAAYTDKTVPTSNGIVNVDFTQPMETPSTMIFTVESGTNLDYNIENSVKVEMFGDILSNVYTETLREEEGGAYSPYAYSNLSRVTGKWQLISSIQTNNEQQDAMISRSMKETMKLLNEGADEVQFNKVKEALLNQYNINVRKNGYWLQNLRDYIYGYDMITNNEAAIKNLTLKDFNSFLKTLWNGDNCLKVVMEGVPVQK